jgi:hypothetical protein
VSAAIERTVIFGMANVLLGYLVAPTTLRHLDLHYTSNAVSPSGSCLSANPRSLEQVVLAAQALQLVTNLYQTFNGQELRPQPRTTPTGVRRGIPLRAFENNQLCSVAKATPTAVVQCGQVWRAASWTSCTREVRPSLV